MIISLLLWLTLAAPYDPPCLAAEAGRDTDSYVLELQSLTPDPGWTLWSDRPGIAYDGSTFGVLRPLAPLALPNPGKVLTRAFEPYTIYICAPDQPLPRTFLPMVQR